MIYNFELFCESLGLLKSLEEIANEIIKQVNTNDKKECTIKTKYLGQDIKIYCHSNKEAMNNNLRENPIAFLILNPNYEYEIVGNLSYSNIMHELKHMDRDIRKKKKNDYGQVLSFSARRALIDHNHLLKKGEHKDDTMYVPNKNTLLLSILYYQDQNEFESFFHSMYYDIQNLFISKCVLNKEEKRKIIDGYLNNYPIYLVYKSLYENKFNLLDYFKNKKDINFFIEHFNKIFNIIKDQGIGKHVISTKSEIFIKYWKYKLKNIFNKDRKDTDKKIKEINYQINKSIQRNYKKIYRLYSLFNI